MAASASAASSRFRAVRNAARRLAWAIVALLALFAASGISYALGLGIYIWQGKPGSYAQVVRQRSAQSFVASVMYRSSDPALANLRVGVTEESFLNRARDSWTRVESGALRWRGQGPSAVYATSASGLVTRFTLLVPDVDAGIASVALTRTSMLYGPAEVSAGKIGDAASPAQITVWRDPEWLLYIEFRRESDGSFTMIDVMIHASDPRYRLLYDTGGVPRTHALAASIREDLAKPKSPAPPRSNPRIERRAAPLVPLDPFFQSVPK